MAKVTHFEIPMEDVEGMQGFYKSVFDWKITEVPMPEGDPYYMVETVETDENNMPKEAGAINGGMAKKGEDFTKPLIVIEVESIDEYMKKVKEAGGGVAMEKIPVMDMGFYARFKDPEGNVIGLWENK